MPKFTFICNNCDKHTQLYTSVEVKSIPCECRQNLLRQMPIINKSTVTEVVDSFLGVSLQQDNKEILEQRKLEYFWSIEVPRLVNKYSVEHCLQNQWLYIDDKGQLQIQTKPPNKR